MRAMAKVVGWLAVVPMALLTLVVLSEPPTWSGAAYVLGADACVAALVLAGRPLAARLARLGGGLIAATVAVRVGWAGGGATVSMSTSGEGSQRLVDRLVDERDLSVNAARAMAWTGAFHDPDLPELSAAMRSAYDDMARDQPDAASPVLATYLGLERPKASDTIEIPAAGATDGAVIFLHGYAGNFTMSCWLFANAARRAHMTTVCPSTRWVGDWWSADGEATVRATLAVLRARGMRRVYLAGLSNGAIGASLLATRVSGFAGLVLVSGAAPEASAPGIPTLVVQGRDDGQIPASLVHGYAERAGARYVEVDAGHFAMLTRRARVEGEISAWLLAQGLRARSQAMREVPASIAKAEAARGTLLAEPEAWTRRP